MSKKALLFFALTIFLLSACGFYSSKYVSQQNVQEMNTWETSGSDSSSGQTTTEGGWSVSKTDDRRTEAPVPPRKTAPKKKVTNLEAALLSKKVPIQAAGENLDSINFGNYHALVIGNNNYRHVSNLITAINDAEAETQYFAQISSKDKADGKFEG